MKRAPQYLPVHGRDVAAGWDALTVYTRAAGFGPGVWIREPGARTKRPGETADDVRRVIASETGRRVEDIALEGMKS